MPETTTLTAAMPSNAQRISDREFVVERVFAAPAHLVFDAWVKVDQFKQWWVPASCGLTLRSCTLEVAVGSTYRLVFEHEGATFEVFGTYREVTPPKRLVWTNEEGDDGETITTVTFEMRDGVTSLRVHDLYASKAALDAAISMGATDGMPESLAQLDAFLASRGTD